MLGILYKINIRILWKIEKNQTGSGAQGPRNNMVVSFIGFILFFYSSYTLDLQLKKSSTWKCQQAQTNKSPNKILLATTKGPGKRQPRQTDNFCKITILLQQITSPQQRTVSIPTHATTGRVEILGFHPDRAVTGALTY